MSKLAEVTEELIEPTKEQLPKPQLAQISLSRDDSHVFRSKGPGQELIERVEFNGRSIELYESSISGGSYSSDSDYCLYADGELVSRKDNSTRIPYGKYEGDYHQTSRHTVPAKEGVQYEVYRVKSVGYGELPEQELLGVLTFDPQQLDSRKIRYSEPAKPRVEAALDQFSELDGALEEVVRTFFNNSEEVSNSEYLQKTREELIKLSRSLIAIGDAMGAVLGNTLPGTDYHQEMGRIEKLGEGIACVLNEAIKEVGKEEGYASASYKAIRNLSKAFSETVDAFTNLPKKFRPESAFDLKSGDVLVFNDGTRAITEYGREGYAVHDLIIRHPNGRIEDKNFVKGVEVFNMLHRGDFSHIERGNHAQLFPGVTVPMKVTSTDPEFYEAGDIILHHKDSDSLFREGSEKLAASVILSNEYDYEKGKRQVNYLSLTPTRNGNDLRSYHFYKDEVEYERRRGVKACTLIDSEDMNATELMERGLGTIRYYKRHESQRDRAEVSVDTHPAVGAFTELTEKLKLELARRIQGVVEENFARSLHRGHHPSENLADTYELAAAQQGLDPFIETLDKMSSLLSAYATVNRKGSGGLRSARVSEEESSLCTPLSSPADSAKHYVDEYNKIFNVIYEDSESRDDLSLDQKVEAAQRLGQLQKLTGVMGKFLTETLERVDGTSKRQERAEEPAQRQKFSIREIGREGELQDGDFQERLKELLGQVGWEKRASDGESRSMGLHYQPESVIRLLNVPGSRLRCAFKDDKMVGAFFHFEGDQLPADYAALAAKSGIPTSGFDRLQVNDNEHAGYGITTLFKMQQIIHAYRRGEEMSFGTIATDHSSSWAARLIESASIEDAGLLACSRTVDGSLVTKLVCGMSLDPEELRLLQLVEGRPEYKGLLQLIKSAGEKAGG